MNKIFFSLILIFIFASFGCSNKTEFTTDLDNTNQLETKGGVLSDNIIINGVYQIKNKVNNTCLVMHSSNWEPHYVLQKQCSSNTSFESYKLKIQHIGNNVHIIRNADEIKQVLQVGGPNIGDRIIYKEYWGQIYQHWWIKRYVDDFGNSSYVFISNHTGLVLYVEGYPNWNVKQEVYAGTFTQIFQLIPVQ